MSMKATFLAISVSAFAVAAVADDAPRANATQALGPLTSIASLDVARYMGTWFEIAKYPNWFQRTCVSNTKAEYTAQADGSVRVVNRCNTGGGRVKEAVGVARQIGAASSPKLQVQFTRPGSHSFLFCGPTIGALQKLERSRQGN